jgi:hypothetical protein
MMLAAIRRSDGAWFVDQTRDADRSAIFGARDERARFDTSDAENVAHVLLTEAHDVAIVCEAFPSLGL